MTLVSGALQLTSVQRKICVLGDPGVGKSGLVQRFVNNRFPRGRKLGRRATGSLPLTRKEITWPDGRLVNLMVWELGLANLSGAAGNLLQGAAGVLLVCDLTRPDTLLALAHYAELVKDAAPQAPLLILANKSDLLEQRQVAAEDLYRLTRQMNSFFLFTSAKTGQGVEHAFNILVSRLLEAGGGALPYWLPN